jgi:hypothetical protein
VVTRAEQGCQIFLDTIYQNGGEIYQIALNYQNSHNMYQLDVVHTKWPKIYQPIHSKDLQNLPKLGFLV